MSRDSYFTHLECTACATQFPTDRWIGTCSACGRTVVARYDLARIRAEVSPDVLLRRPATMWRYREFLPLHPGEVPITLGEGMTPLVPLSSVGPAVGLPRLVLKDEGLNPTGTFKARGASVAASKVKALGVTHVIVPTVGSGGSAWAAYGARAQLNVVIGMTAEDAPMIARKDTVITGARTFIVDGTTTDLFAMSLRAAERYGWTPIVALREPYRTEGKKTMGFEIAEQLQWELPDVILYPTGGGVGIVALAKAFEELEAAGWIGSKRPRLISVQAAGCAPVVKALLGGADVCEPWVNMRTRVPGVKIARPFADWLILKTVRASGGTGVAVEDEVTLEMQRRIAKTEGLFISPEGAMVVAGAAQLRDAGVIGEHETVVCFNTATGMRYPHLIEETLPVFRADQELVLDDAQQFLEPLVAGVR